MIIYTKYIGRQITTTTSGMPSVGDGGWWQWQCREGLPTRAVHTWNLQAVRQLRRVEHKRCIPGILGI